MSGASQGKRTSTPLQLAARRANSLKSTGPRTRAGKKAVRLNALRHGILSQEVLLPGEDESLLEELRQQVLDDLQPQGGVENLLVDRIVSLAWRLRRLQRIEAGLIANGIDTARRVFFDPLQAWKDSKQPAVTGDAEETEPGITEKNAKRLAKRKTEITRFGQAFFADAQNADAFGKLCKYETSLQRMMVKTLHELERVQGNRSGRPVPPPVAVDVNISSSDSDG